MTAARTSIAVLTAGASFFSSAPVAMPAGTGTADFLPHPEHVWGCLQTFLFLSLQCSPGWVRVEGQSPRQSFSPGIHGYVSHGPSHDWGCCAAKATSGGSFVMGTVGSVLFLGIQVACGGRASVCAKPSFCPDPCLKPVTTGHTLDDSSTILTHHILHLRVPTSVFPCSMVCVF